MMLHPAPPRRPRATTILSATFYEGVRHAYRLQKNSCFVSGHGFKVCRNMRIKRNMRTKSPSLCGVCCLYRFDLERKRLSLEKFMSQPRAAEKLMFCIRLQFDRCQAVPIRASPDFSPGERVFKPARTLYLAMRALQAAKKTPVLYQGTTLVGPQPTRLERALAPEAFAFPAQCSVFPQPISHLRAVSPSNPTRSKR